MSANTTQPKGPVHEGDGSRPDISDTAALEASDGDSEFGESLADPLVLRRIGIPMDRMLQLVGQNR